VLSLNPHDPEVIVELAKLNLLLTKTLDEFCSGCVGRRSCHRSFGHAVRARGRLPTLVRPGDEKFTRTKLASLRVGDKAPGRVKTKRPPSFATASNRLAQRLCRRIELRARAVAGRTSKQAWLTLRITEPDIPDSQHESLLEILREVKPLSKKNLKWWNGALSDLFSFSIRHLSGPLNSKPF